MYYAYLFLIFIAVVIVLSIPTVIVPRIKMERRARKLLVERPDAERTSIYLKFNSTFANEKRREMDRTIEAMEKEGLTFLRSSEANPLRTILSKGGGINLQFIRNSGSNITKRFT